MGGIIILEHPIKINEDSVEFDNERLYFYQSQYNDGTTAIYCETESGQPYDSVSIDVFGHLSDRGLRYNEIVLNHNLSFEFKEMFYKLFCNNIEQDFWSCKEIQYGFSYSNIVELYPILLKKTYNGVIRDI